MSAAAQLIALAARTPVGYSAEATAAAVRAQVSRLQEHPIFVDAGGHPVTCGLVAGVAPRLMGPARLAELARPALVDLASRLPAVVRGKGAPIPLLLSLPEERPGWRTADAAVVSRALVDAGSGSGLRLEVRAVGVGHAGGALAVRLGLELLSQRRVELCVIGGVDSYLDGAALDWLEEHRRLACPEARGGLPPGEAAVFLALASDDLRRRLKLEPLAAVRGAACSEESSSAPEGPNGQGMTKVIVELASFLRPPDERFEDCYSDLNGERARTDDLCFALLRTAERFRDATDYESPVSSTGDVGAATLLLNVVLAARSWARGYARGKNAVVLGASFGGARGGALLAAPEGVA